MGNLHLLDFVQKLDQVSSMGVQLVIRNILTFFPYWILLNTPHHSCTPTKQTWSQKLWYQNTRRIVAQFATGANLLLNLAILKFILVHYNKTRTIFFHLGYTRLLVYKLIWRVHSKIKKFKNPFPLGMYFFHMIPPPFSRITDIVNPWHTSWTRRLNHGILVIIY